jgi:competence protein ComEC
LVVLTHLHADHVGGISGVLRHRAVAEAQVGPLDEPPAQAARVAGDLAAAGVPVARAVAGERRASGPVSWQVVWPQRVIRTDGSVPNNASVVLLVDVAGVRLLLTGDVEPAAQRALQPVLAGLLGGRPVDVLKVAHHGSALQSPELLAMLRPRVALVSVGAENRYGHPDPGTLGLLSATGAVIRRTDLGGDLALVGPSERLGVVARGR